ncbi:MAG: IS200/IS605 family transposase [Saprospiraceae bacterium]|mgnify:FL=1|nr:IS200/IS605 family transposase [Saprospiraceae bacterium]HPG09578.1 IS200/IS605 family transposase [Saprospiraceae bacterium]
MANTYTQIHIQTVFAVKNRACLIEAAWKDDLYKYMTGIIQNRGHKLLAINGMADHIHIFFGMRPVDSLSELMKWVKGSSSEWINNNGFANGKFAWQGGFGAFSYSKSQVQDVIKYIRNQEEHHTRKLFIDEYVELLQSFDIEYDDQYIFNPIF